MKQSKRGGKQGSGESSFRSFFYLLLAMMGTFFLLVSNKKLILSILNPSSSSPLSNYNAVNAAEGDKSSTNIPTSQYSQLSQPLQKVAPLTTTSQPPPAAAGTNPVDELAFLKSEQKALYPPGTKYLPEGKGIEESDSQNIPGAYPPESITSGAIPTVRDIPKLQSPEIITSKGKDGKSLLESSIQCPASVHEKYQRVPIPANGDGTVETPAQLMKWCQGKARQNRVEVGRSWGSLSRNDRMEWDRRRCNELLTRGKLQTCDEQWGWAYFQTWQQNQKKVLSPAAKQANGSSVTCIVDYKTTSYCDMRNVRLDFSKMSEQGQTRSFFSGFLTLYGERDKEYGAMPMYPGLSLQNDPGQSIASPSTCDSIEDRPTFILSNDDIYNLGHYINDVVGIWAMTVLSHRLSKNALLINIDGYREGGPAGGPAHRIMIPNSPDLHGPYSPSYYETWFSEVKKARDYRKQRVCYKELYVFPLPGVPWFWNDWGRISDCSMISSSPLYQSFNVFLRQHLLNYYRQKFSEQQTREGNKGKQLVTTLANPPTDHVHIVIEVRKINPAKHGAKTNSGRVIANLPALIKRLEVLPNVKVTAQDFALLSFPEQIALAHTASILISMHGAGTTHIFHMALGQPNCCGLVELFPDQTVDLYTAEGYGNLARMLGIHHYRLVGAMGSTTPKGTLVDIEGIQRLVEKLMRHVTDTPTCLHEVQDTTARVVV